MARRLRATRGPYAPGADYALERILTSEDREEALRRMTALLRRSWRHGYVAGWGDGVQDATEDEPGPQNENPYDE